MKLVYGKIEDLENILNEQGVPVRDLFSRVGLKCNGSLEERDQLQIERASSSQARNTVICEKSEDETL